MPLLVLNEEIRCFPPAHIVFGTSAQNWVNTEPYLDAQAQWWTYNASQSWVFNCVAVAQNYFIATPSFSVAVEEPNAVLANAAIARLRDVVEAIREVRPLQPCAGLEGLLTEATASRGMPDDVEDWARRLAADIGDLSD